MRLETIKQSYDDIFSLGDNCQTAHQLQKNNLRRYSGPLDWFVLPTNSLIRLLQNHFNQFMDLNNLEVRDVVDEHYVVFDTMYKSISMHDYPVLPFDHEWYESHSQFKERMERRLTRLFHQLQTNESTLFVKTRATYEEAMSIKQYLSPLISGEWKLLIVNYTTEPGVTVEYAIDNIVSVKIPNPKHRWQGCDTSWNQLLDGISLRDKS